MFTFFLFVENEAFSQKEFKDSFLLHEPKFHLLEKEWQEIDQKEMVFEFGQDSLVLHQMHLMKNKDNLPLMYFAAVLTPVCIDGLCKPLFIELYWDLLGAYIGFAVNPKEPLTKFDHELFTSENYQKLDALLLDPHSVLERKTMDDLQDKSLQSDKQITFKGKEVDAVSGATKKEIKASVVEGALYSCYTLWHLVHGAAALKIKENIHQIYTNTLADYFLNAPYEDYQFYALKQFQTGQFNQYKKDINSIFKKGKPLLRSYILKKMPDELWQDSLFTKELFADFFLLDFNSKTLLIKNLSKTNSQLICLLSNQISGLSKNQLKKYLDFLQNNLSYWNLEMETNFKKVIDEGIYTYSYLLNEFLENNKEIKLQH
jgi:hypothetical protein